MIYDHYPVDIKTFIDSPHYLDVADECWPEIRTKLIDLFDLPPSDTGLSSCDEFVFKAGIGAGKSYLISILFSYVLYRLLCFKNPQRMYGLAKGSKIALVNMSKNATQARKVVFGEITARIVNSPWFQQFGLPDKEIRSELRFNKDIIIIPGNSEETFPLGFNVFCANLDEAAFFTDTSVHDLAEEIFMALKRRINSRFGSQGIIGITSSPRYEEDFIERKFKEAELAGHIRSAIITTWDSKPDDVAAVKAGDFFESPHPKTGELVKIPKRYEYDFKSNPERAWRDYGAIPSLVLEPYIKQYDLFLDGWDKDRKAPITEDGVLLDWFVPDMAFKYYIHIDLALVNDACGVAMTHMQEDKKVVIDLIHRITGSKGKEIDITEVRNLVLGIHQRGFRLGKVTYDQFQSASSIQELNKKGIKSEQLSVDKTLAPYETFKECAYNGKLSYYEHKVFMAEVRRLELKEGKKVDHPAKGSKDCADAAAGAVYNAVQGGIRKIVKVKVL